MKALIIRFSSLGDVVLATAIARVLKREIRDVNITFATKEEYADILSLSTDVDDILILNKPYKLKELVNLKKRIRIEKFNTIFDLHNNIRSRFITSTSSASIVYRYSKKALKRRMLVLKSWFNIFTKNIYKNHKVKIIKGDTLTDIEHTIDRYLDVLKNVGVYTNREKPSLVLSGSDEKESKKTKVAFVPGAKWYTKEWGINKFIQLGILLQKKYDAEIVILGDKNNMSLASSIAKRIKAVNLTGKTNLVELANNIKKCKVVITGDSAISHIAMALDIPVVSIFGPTVIEFGFFPFHRSYIIFSELLCRPCSLHGNESCPIRTHICMGEIKPADLLNCIDELISPCSMMGC